MKRTLSGWLWADVASITYISSLDRQGGEGDELFLGAVIANSAFFLGVDLLTGAAYKQLPAKLHVEFSKDTTPQANLDKIYREKGPK